MLNPVRLGGAVARRYFASDSGRLLHNLNRHTVSLVTQQRYYGRVNMVVNFVPTQEAWIIERFGKYTRTLMPGLNVVIPIVESIKYVQSLKEVAIDIPHQSAITTDNVTLHIDGVLYLKVIDPYQASYGVENPTFAITQLAQTTMRSEIGKITLDTVFRDRDALNVLIVEAINKASVRAWGIECLRYEIRDVKLPPKVEEAMRMQVEAERVKRARILESEGYKEAEINRAQGERQGRILKSEAVRIEQVNHALGDAQAKLAMAEAEAKALQAVGRALASQTGNRAASLQVAKQYVGAFSNLAKSSTSVLLPSSTGDVTSMVTQAMSVYKALSEKAPEDTEAPAEDKSKELLDDVKDKLDNIEVTPVNISLDDYKQN